MNGVQAQKTATAIAAAFWFLASRCSHALASSSVALAILAFRSVSYISALSPSLRNKPNGKGRGRLQPAPRYELLSETGQGKDVIEGKQSVK